MMATITQLWSCAKPQATSTTQPVAAKPVEKTAERGPAKLVVRVPRQEITVGDKLPLSIEVLADAGVMVLMPHVDPTLGKFEVSDLNAPPDIPDGAKRRWIVNCNLRTLESGEQEIPQIAIKFTDSRQLKPGESAAVDSELSAGPITIK